MATKKSPSRVPIVPRTKPRETVVVRAPYATTVEVDLGASERAIIGVAPDEEAIVIGERIFRVMEGGKPALGYAQPKIVPMLLWCPACGKRHIDAGEFATKRHHTHACQKCGVVWRPAIVPTCGVQFLPGCKDLGEHPF